MPVLMNPAYSYFAERNPTTEDTIGSMVSCISPDPKGITLWSMMPGRGYSEARLYERVIDFSGVELPISERAVWTYCDGNRPRCKRGSLHRAGFVEALKGDGPTSRRYVKTPAGEELGDAIAARSLMVSGMMGSRYRSMVRIFSNRGLPTHKVLRFLATHQGNEYREKDVREAIEVPLNTLSPTLKLLGMAGVINFDSPTGVSAGKWRTGWARYRMAEGRDFLSANWQELYDEMRRKQPNFSQKSAFRDVCSHIQAEPDSAYSCSSLSSTLGVGKAAASKTLAFLKRCGYLVSDFEGRVSASKVTANEDTVLLWEMLLEPIDILAHEGLDTYACRGLYDPLRYYGIKPDARKKHIAAMLRIYDRERQTRGSIVREEIDSILLSSIPPGEGMKLGHITELVNVARGVTVTSQAMNHHMRRLMDTGLFVRAGNGYYVRRKNPVTTG